MAIYRAIFTALQVLAGQSAERVTTYMNAPLPPDEAQRLDAVRRYEILDTAPEAAFERLTRLAARLFDVPVAIVNLLDAERQWFKSCHGLNFSETARDIAFCAYAILSDELLLVPDATRDARFIDSPLVTGETAIRFYAGAPLHTTDGFNVGTLAIMDTRPRSLSEAETTTLTDLAALVVDEMELRLAAMKLRERAGQEREEASRQQQRNETYFRSLIENASDIIAVVNGDGTLRYQSPAGERLLGYEPGELYETNVLRLIHPDDVEAVQQALARVFQEPGVAQTVAYRFQHHDGSWRVLESTGKTLPEDALASGIVVNSRDVTERKEAVSSLQNAKDQLQIVLDMIPGGVSWIGADLNYQGVNRYLAESYNLPAANFVGQPIGFLGVSSGYEEFVRDFLSGEAEQTTFEFTSQIQGASHTTLITARKYDGGRAAIFVGTDISERKAFEDALQQAHDELEVRVLERTQKLAAAVRSLQERESELRSLTENAPDIIARFDRQLRHVFINPAIERMTGLSPSQFLGKTNREMYSSPELVAQWEAKLKQVFETGQPVRSEFAFPGLNGETLYFESRTTPEIGADGTVETVLTISRDITERVRIERELQDSEDRFKLLIEAIPQQVWTVRTDGALDYVNRRILEYFKRSFEQMIGWGWDDVIHPDDMADMLAHWQRALENGEPYETEFRLRRSDGVYRWYLVRALPLRDAENRIVKWLGTNTDITERKETIAELQKTQARLQLVLSSTPAVFYTANATPPYRTTFVSENAPQQLGYHAAEILAVPDFWSDHIHPDDKPPVLAAMPRLLEQDTLSQEYRMRNRAGDYVWIYDETNLVRDHAGKPQELVGFTLDITERKAAEDALRQSEARKTAIVETALDCVIGMDHEGRVIEWNPAAETTFGYAQHEVMGQLLADLVIPEGLRERHHRGLARYLESGQSVMLGRRIELCAQRADGSEILVEVAITPVPVNGTPIFTAYLRDITDRKRDEQALQAAKAEAERANRAKSEFISRMSHELRTPLNAILGFGQLLEMDELNAEQRQAITQILKGGHHLLDLINDVLDIARIEAQPPPVDLEALPVVELLSEALDLVRPLATPAQIVLTSDWSAAQGLFLLADRRSLLQVLLNLLSNAVKYNRSGGAVKLSCAPVGENQLRITVSDTGRGIAPENIERLWLPFDRLDAERDNIQGSGLGLSLTRPLVETMNGSIHVESVVGQGSSFMVELPLAPGNSDGDSRKYLQSATRSMESVGEVKVGETQAVVLYIEDDLSNFGLVQSILRHRPEIKMLAARRGRLGLELAAKHRPNLILLDVNLPDLHGEEVLRALRAAPHTQDIPIIVISVDATARQMERMRAAGADEYLTKPLDVKQFLSILETLLGKTSEPNAF